ncbi:MAG: ATP-binding protein [Parcubacteria group bacterium]|jgi:signal transduction histidine kinase
MDFNSVTNIEQCAINLPQMINVGLLYYAHIPTAIIALIFGLFVLFKNKKDLSAKILFAISATFSIWTLFNLIVWVSYDSRVIMFFWAPLGIFEILFFILSLYFVYVFEDKEDISFIKKIVLGLLILPSILLAATKLNLSGFNLSYCEATDTRFILNYDNIIEVFISIWIAVVLVRKYIKVEKVQKKQVLLLATGIILFLVSFFITSYIAYAINIFSLEVYGLFGMTIFLGFLTYLIVKFKAFNIKLIASQALVMGLVILIGSEFFFAENSTNQILIGITLAISIILGYQLVKSVKREVERKEQLETLSTQLAVANDKLHQLDKAKSEFISIASHQLRTPLTAIKGFVSLLLEGTYGQIPLQQRPPLEKVYVSNERLVQLVEDLLNISRIESGRMEFDFQEAQVEDLITEAVNTLDLSAKNKGLYLTWEKPEKMLPKFKMDITKIKEVVSNMVDNALKYTQKGGVTVRTETSENGKSARVIVSDTGIGMDKDDIEQIFEKFQRGKEISHYHTDGTGLGMFIARKVVTAHQGRIWAESEGKGRGSRFIMELPIE